MRRWRRPLLVLLGLVGCVSVGLSAYWSVGVNEPTDLATIWALPAAIVLGVLALVGSTIGVRPDVSFTGRSEFDRFAHRRRTAEAKRLVELLGGAAERAELRFETGLPGHRAQQLPAAATSLDQVWAQFASGAVRRLVVLGSPGAGKTVAVLDLASFLNSDASFLPVPMRFDITRWPDQMTLSAWLVRELEAIQIGAEAARDLVEDRKILPILDGLDEMDSQVGPSTRGRLAISKLNAPSDSLIPDAVVVTSRTSYYARLAQQERLNDAVSIALEPIDASSAVAYIEDRTKRDARWDPVTAALVLNPGLPISVALRNPWRLSLALARYSKSTTVISPVNLLSFATSSDLDSHLLDSMVPSAMARSVGGSIRFVRLLGQRRIDRSLREFALYLEANRSSPRVVGGRTLPATDIVPHEIWPMAGQRLVRNVDMTLCIIMSAPGLVWLTLFALEHSAIGVPLMPVFGVLYVLALVRTSRAFWVPPSRASFRKLVSWRAIPQAGFGVIAGVVLASIAGSAVGFAVGLAAWIAGGLSIGIMQGLANPLQEATGPRVPLRRDRAISLLSALAVGPLCAVAFYYYWGVLGAVLGVAYAIVVGMTVAAASWRRYIVFVVCARRLPWVPLLFLEWAYRVGLLRVSGTAYQFRHLEFQEWIAR